MAACTSLYPPRSDPMLWEGVWSLDPPRSAVQRFSVTGYSPVVREQTSEQRYTRYQHMIFVCHIELWQPLRWCSARSCLTHTSVRCILGRRVHQCGLGGCRRETQYIRVRVEHAMGDYSPATPCTGRLQVIGLGCKRDRAARD